MRRRRHKGGASILAGCFVLSFILHISLSFPLRNLANAYLASGGPTRPVELVRLSPSDWNATLRAARAARARGLPSGERPRPAPTRSSPEAEKKLDEAKKTAPQEERLHGTVVEVPPTPDSSPNPGAKYLSKYNTHVEKESVARVEDRDPSRRRVTSRLQTRERSGASPETPVTPGLSVRGSEGPPSEVQKDASEGGTSKFAFKVPTLERRDALDLKLLEGPGLDQRAAKQLDSEALKGNSDRLELRLGEDVNGQGSGRSGTGQGEEHQKGSEPSALPTLNGLVPTLGTVADLSGSPSRDHVEGVPEGDGTFLNTKEFKYATFFYRVRDSVASHWEDLAAREYRRRDPTGNIYGIRDRATLLQIRLTREGKLDNVQVASTSGVDFLDQVAMEAFEMAQPFPNPPPGIADADGSIRFNFQFVVTMRSRSPLNIFNFQ